MPDSKDTRDDIRNIAIIAHVDHGKTTLVDALLRQSGTFAAHEERVDRVMDAGLERERGITILAKNTAVRYGETKINIIDTPGHADFGGEVERGLSMVDGVLLLVDAVGGAAAADAVRAAQGARRAAAGDPRGEQDRPPRRAHRRGRRRGVRALLRRGRRRVADRLPDRLHERAARHRDARPGVAGREHQAAARPDRLAHPGADLHPGHPFQAQVANLDSSPYLGRLALCRVRHGEIARGSTVAWCRGDGTVSRMRLTELLVTEGLERVAGRAGRARRHHRRRRDRRDR